MDKGIFLDTCVQHAFDQIDVDQRSMCNAPDIEIPPRCVLLEVADKEINILKKDEVIQEVRLKAFLIFLQEVLSTFKLKFHFRFVLNTYDEDKESEFPIFGFSRECSSQNILPVPDPHLTSNYLGMRVNDFQPLAEKIPKIVFRGTDTGPYPDAESNDRIYFCNKFKDDDRYDFKISKFLDYTPELLSRQNYDINTIKGEYLSHEEQARYQYIADINGHTIAWDRNCWALPLNSVLIKFQKKKDHEYETWYSNYLYSHKIVPVCRNQENVRELKGREEELINEQKEFSKLLLSRRVNMEYLKRLLHLYQEKYHT